MAYSKMAIGSFTFPHNPTTSTVEGELAYVAHEYPSVNGGDLESLGSKPATIECSGEFVSDENKTAKQYWDALYSIYKAGKIVKLVHPVWTGNYYCLITKIKGTIEPMVGVISYEFTIVVDRRTSSTQSLVGKVTVKKTHTVTYKTTKKNQNISSIVKSMNKKYKKYNPKFTTSKVKNWNKGIKNWKKIPKGTKIKFKYTTTYKV